ncbi:beta-eliminating lyase family protein [Burkholderia thailandensis MSMB121]|uniref:threonine aldolase family protein n=1 Tax=Burkholderia humptydooensis TaxID=430531 RepID=UPI00032810C6|nr:GntG family PLP-dependent aldolase [Burkholderia humptydooensis]AGK49370.1 beta-eliminating lyase family protein [Burkholderia thailandensis MSMB121]KST74595.1 hypothetical protein WS76_10795 [Burkholderia humptydooensis]
MIDLRTDAASLPPPGMRRAMACAAMGDDAVGEDPSVNALQAHMAALLGMEAALFLPTTTMANLAAVCVHGRPGDTVITDTLCHLHVADDGAQRFAGVRFHALPGDAGRLAAADVARAIQAARAQGERPCLIALEHPHNRGGGALYALDALRDVIAAAHRHDVPVHLDGARLLNAAIATNRPVHEIVEGVDTVAVCFSKGLACPAGAILAGNTDVIDAARSVRHALGGGMAQAGVLAAAARWALRDPFGPLVEDHRRAARLRAALRHVDGLEVIEIPPSINLVFATLTREGLRAEDVVKAMKHHDIRIAAFGPQRVRMALYRGVTDADIDQVAAALADVMAVSAVTHERPQAVRRTKVQGGPLEAT